MMHSKSPSRLAARKARGLRASAQLMSLVLATLALGTFSISKLHAGGSVSSAELHTQKRPAEEAEFVRLGFGGAQQEEAQQQQQGQQPQPQQTLPEGGTCFDKYKWIQPALDIWYEKAWAAANQSTQTTEQALQTLRDSMWNKYHPGMDEVILRPDGKGGVAMDVLQVAPPNQMHKKRCMLGLLQDAVERHSAELAALLGEQEMHFIVETEDFGVTWKAQKNKIPAFAMCTDDNHSDIPVPDFTFYCYPEARYKNSSWPAVQSLLQHKSDMVAWHERHSELFHRSNWHVGPRRGLMPLLQQYDNGTGPKTAKEAFGCELDISDSGFVQVNQGKASPNKHDAFVWLDGQCDYKYLIHTAGFSYSASLKYKLACGSMVFKFESMYKEFFEPALQDQYHVIKLPARHDGVDPEMFEKYTAPLIKQVVDRTINIDFHPPIPARAQEFVREQLNMEALHCYWLGALQRYAELYFLPKTVRQLELEKQEGAGGSGGKTTAGASSGGGGGDGGGSSRRLEHAGSAGSAAAALAGRRADAAAGGAAALPGGGDPRQLAAS